MDNQESLKVRLSLTDPVWELWQKAVHSPGTIFGIHQALNAPSKIKASNFKKFIPNKRVLLLDFGGTYTKHSLFATDSHGIGTYSKLLRERNESFDRVNGGKTPFERLVRASVGDLNDQYKLHEQPIDGLGIIWSNAQENIARKGEVKGVGAAMMGVENSSKGEFFMKDATNGTRVDEYFIEEFKKLKIPLNVIVVCNDTIFTMLAGDNCDGGAIASTGANATLVSHDEIYNPEIGVYLKLPSKFLSIAEQEYLKTNYTHMRNASPDYWTLESIMSGAFIHQCFQINLNHMNEAGHFPEKEKISAWLKSWGENFVQEIVVALCNQDFNFLSQTHIRKLNEDTPAFLLSKEYVTPICTLARQLMERGGYYLALMSHLSTLHVEHQKRTVALDSTQATYCQIFRKSFEATLRDFGNLSSQLLCGDAESDASVPMLGASKAVHGFF